MRRPSRAAVSAVAVALLLALAALPGAAVAADRDPRCADWERHGAPPGVDMAVMCPDASLLGPDLGLADEPLVPYIIALLVAAAVLAITGFAAMRFLGPRRRVSRPDEWWACPTCGERNLPARPTCFACHASRGAAAPTTT